ncbi:MAG: SRPBCC family protein [Myxococcota bacterium]
MFHLAFAFRLSNRSRFPSSITPPPGAVRSALVGFLLVAGLSFATTASAQGLAAEEARLGLFSAQERALLAPHLEHGPLAFVEFSGEAELPAVIFATTIRAPASTVVRVISNPEGYPRFMPALDSVNIQSRRDRNIAYEWTWQTAIFTLHGTNVMTVYPSSERRRDRPFRVESRATGGDLGTGRFMWRVYPQGPNRSLIVLSSRIDLRDANYVTREIGGGRRSINRTINIALASVMTLGTKKEAERIAGAPPIEAGEVPGLTRPDVDFVALAPMLMRGDLLLMQMQGERLDRIAVVGRPGATVDRVYEVMSTPEEFGRALIPGSYARPTEERPGEVDFEWGINIPLIGTSGEMTLARQPHQVSIDATDGGLDGGQWRFVVERLPWGEPMLIGWARFDLATAGWFVRSVIAGDAAFGNGLTTGAQLMLMRAIRSRARAPE